METNEKVNDGIIGAQNSILGVPPNLTELPTTGITANTAYVVSGNTSLGTTTFPVGVTLYFMGGIISGTTLTGNKTKIIAPITQIFNASLNVTGTWDIDRSYPQWFGAQSYTSISTSSVDCAAAINKAILMKQTGEVFIPRGWYRVNSSIIVKNGIILSGEPGIPYEIVATTGTVLVPGASLSSYTGGFFMRHNINSTGDSWEVNHAAGTVIKYLQFSNQYYGGIEPVVNLRGILSVGSIEIDSCFWWNFKQAFSELFLYSDLKKVTKCACWHGWNDREIHTGATLYAFDFNSLGDGFLFEQNAVAKSFFTESGEKMTKALRVNMCNGGRIDANILNNDVLIEGSKAITFTSNHLEDGAQVEFRNSNVTSMNNFFTKGTLPSLVVNSASDANGPVVKSSGDLFLFYDKREGDTSSYDITTISEYDVQVKGSLPSLEFSQTYRYRVLAGEITAMMTHGILVCDASSNPISAFNQQSYLLSTQGRIMPHNNVVNSNYVNDILTPNAFGYGHHDGAKWNKEPGTYYYKYQILWDRARLIAGQSGILTWIAPSGNSIYMTENGPGLLIRFANGALCGNQSILRLYRGTSTNYTQYIDIPVTGADALYDNGFSISGFRWKSIGGEYLTSVNTNITAIRYNGKNIECKAPAAPIVGTWTEGDIVFNTNPNTTNPNTVHWIFLGGAWRSKP
ncbi:MAG: glycoside hydrolase family 55 protein [Tannerella sp.]|jgi:hypothetical protein|nr:glycoside hydrolase family 55 protein [Tannerella sp.]